MIRRALLLENVGALSSKQKNCRQLLKFILKELQVSLFLMAFGSTKILSNVNLAGMSPQRPDSSLGNGVTSQCGTARWRLRQDQNACPNFFCPWLPWCRQTAGGFSCWLRQQAFSFRRIGAEVLFQSSCCQFFDASMNHAVRVSSSY